MVTARFVVVVEMPFRQLQMIFRLSPDTEGRNGDSLSADRRSEFIILLPPLATATAAMTLAASLQPFLFYFCFIFSRPDPHRKKVHTAADRRGRCRYDIRKRDTKNMYGVCV
jgi:hypothetical protein